MENMMDGFALAYPAILGARTESEPGTRIVYDKLKE